MDSTVEEASSVLGTQRENVIKVISAMKQRLEESEKREKALGDKLVEASIPDAHLFRHRRARAQRKGNALCVRGRRDERRTYC